MSFILAADAEFAHINDIPTGLVRVGYTTGSVDIKWPPATFKPSDIRMCQDFGSDLTADELDVEPGAATNHEAAVWWPQAYANWKSNKRPEQRFPMLYTFMNNLTPLVNELVANGITSGPVLHLSQPNDSLITAEDILKAASGPFPIGAIQYHFTTNYDLDVYSSDWYMSAEPAIPPGQWLNKNAWTWKQVMVTGIGLNDRLHTFLLNPNENTWIKLILQMFRFWVFLNGKSVCCLETLKNP